ncbi:hypothetical protein BD410DRAFT_792463 [Rickenella mellea]|uniref:Ricin B lectin domain-containing protein n=1 Tax=Rickenella mellea TaxID=50990 RepID=A0A4Y7PX88_9AGAM|nr:hypothetical protein BD410DRAFT_792463 [Rickenella mellea]
MYISLPAGPVDVQRHLSTIVPAIDTERYTITNAKFLNAALLRDANSESDVVAAAAAAEITPNEVWHITLLSNKRYTIQNYGAASFATCRFRATKGDNVVGGACSQQWLILESRIDGRYIISPLNADLCWGLKDDENDTPVTLASTPRDLKNQWIFCKVSM